MSVSSAPASNDTNRETFVPINLGKNCGPLSYVPIRYVAADAKVFKLFIFFIDIKKIYPFMLVKK